MNSLRRETLRHAVVGFVAGAVLGFVPLVTMVAPLLGGGLAGYLERESAKRGAIAGGLAGALMAAFSAILTNVVLFARFGELPFAGSPLRVILFVAGLSLLGALAQVLVAAIGGALGAVLAIDRVRATERREQTREPDVTDGEPTPAARGRLGRLPGALAGLVLGIVTFGVVALGLTVALDPFIWPSALVGLPAGFIAGAAVAVVAFHLLTTPRETRHISTRAVAVGAVALLVIFAGVVGGLSMLGEQRIDRTTESTYEYRVGLSVDSTVENATFYLPLPVEDGASPIGERLVETVTYSRYTPAVQGYDPDPAPVTFSYDVVETEHGPMLAISTDSIAVETVYYEEVEEGNRGWYERIPADEYDPDNPDHGVQHDGSFEFSVTVTANETIDTADPFEDEPLLAPQYDRVEVDCFGPGTASETCYTYAGRVYASYDGPADVLVQLNVGLEARNEWFSGGWTGNSYRDYVNYELTGPQDGWFVTEGRLDVALGRYRD